MKQYLLFALFFVCIGQEISAQAVFTHAKAVFTNGSNVSYRMDIQARLSVPQPDRPIIQAVFTDSLLIPGQTTVLYPSSVRRDSLLRFGLALVDMDSATNTQMKVVAVSNQTFTFSKITRVAQGGYRMLVKTRGDLYTSLGRAPLLQEPVRNGSSHYELLINDVFTVTRVRCLTQTKTHRDTNNYYYEQKIIDPLLDPVRNRLIVAEKIETPQVGPNGTDTVRFFDGSSISLPRVTPTANTYYNNTTTGSYVTSIDLLTNQLVYTLKFRAKAGVSVKATNIDRNGNVFVGGCYLGDTLWINDSATMLKPWTYMWSLGRSFLIKVSPQGRVMWINNVNMTYSSEVTSIKLTNEDRTVVIAGNIEGEVHNLEMNLISDPRYGCGWDLYSPNPVTGILSATTGLFDTAFSVNHRPHNDLCYGNLNVFSAMADGTILWGGDFRGWPRLFTPAGITTWNTMILQATDQNLRPLWRLAVGGPSDGSSRQWVDSHYEPSTGKMYLLGSCFNGVPTGVGVGSTVVGFPTAGMNYFFAEVSQLPVSVKRELSPLAVDIYPNPVSQSAKATIRGPLGTYYVRSTLGKQVGRVVTSNSGEISLAGFATGVYFLQGERGGAPIRFVVE